MTRANDPDNVVNNVKGMRAHVMASIEEEFVQLRGRSLDLVTRYPDLFGKDGDADFHWLEQDGRPVSMLITRSQQFTSGDHSWTGATVGWVHTLRPMQGKGLAAALLEAVAQRFADEGHDFMLLWAHQHGYYRAQGYHVSDSGLLAEGRVDALDSLLPAKGFVSTEISPRDLTRAECVALDQLANAAARGGVPFASRNLSRIPLPFDSVSLVRCGKSSAPDAYALLGHQADWVTVLEGAGDAAALAALIANAAQGVANIRVNARRGSVLHSSLGRVMEFKPKPLAMYRPLSERFGDDELFHAAQWSFPWVDRM